MGFSFFLLHTGFIIIENRNTEGFQKIIMWLYNEIKSIWKERRKKCEYSLYQMLFYTYLFPFDIVNNNDGLLYHSYTLPFIQTLRNIHSIIHWWLFQFYAIIYLTHTAPAHRFHSHICPIYPFFFYFCWIVCCCFCRYYIPHYKYDIFTVGMYIWFCLCLFVIISIQIQKDAEKKNTQFFHLSYFNICFHWIKFKKSEKKTQIVQDEVLFFTQQSFKIRNKGKKYV